MKTSPFAACLLLLVAGLVFSAAGQSAGTKISITSAADLPIHQYVVAGTALGLYEDDQAFAAFAKLVEGDVKSSLARYTFADPAAEAQLLWTLSDICQLQGHYAQALQLTLRARATIAKPSSKRTAGLVHEATLRALIDSRGQLNDAMQRAFAKHLTAALDRLPWALVQENMRAKAGAPLASLQQLRGSLEASIEPAVRQNHALSDRLASYLISLKQQERHGLFTAPAAARILEAYLAAHDVAKPDIWAARSVTFASSQGLTPVVVAIWDSGLDTTLFRHQLYVNSQEQVDGQDDDHNGFVDDRNGIAYDLDGQPTPAMLYPLTPEQQRNMPAVKALAQGFLDASAHINSLEARTAREKQAALQPAEAPAFWDAQALFGEYVHGTHVAGIAAAGNPAIRLLVARNTNDVATPGRALTAEIFRQDAAATAATIQYFKAHGVRVVNMSFGADVAGWIEPNLEAHGIGKTAEERHQLAQELFQIAKRSLYDAIQSSPDILFVAGAGNSHGDSQFQEIIPSSFHLPNLLTVGAADQAGDETSFTSYGANVAVYSNGYRVLSVIPGGEQMAVSGTSMAAPNAVNLAAKLLAINPKLSPPEVIALIQRGTDKNASGRCKLINPKKSMALLGQQLKN